MSEKSKVAIAATQENVLQLDTLSLLGTFGTDADRSALVRHASGRVEKVTMGETVGTSKVVAISKDALFLRSGSKTRKLEMPQG